MEPNSNYINELRSFVASNFLFDDPTSLENDASFLETGIVDSMGILELITFLEKNYGIKVEPAEMVPENFDSLNQLARFVSRKLQKPLPAREARSAS